MSMKPPDVAYTDEQITLALQTLAATGGRPRRAAKILQAESGLDIDPQVLRYWKYRDPERSEQYARLVADTGPRIQRLLVEHHQALAIDAAEAEAEAIEKTAERLDDPELDAKDLSNIAKNLATAGGIHTDKHSVLTGQPTQITGHISLDETISGLAALGVQVEIDGEAVDLPDHPDLAEPDSDPAQIERQSPDTEASG